MLYLSLSSLPDGREVKDLAFVVENIHRRLDKWETNTAFAGSQAVLNKIQIDLERLSYRLVDDTETTILALCDPIKALKDRIEVHLDALVLTRIRLFGEEQRK